MDAKDVRRFATTTNSDIVGGVPESTLNKYSAKHFKQFPDVYKATGIEEQELDLKFNYAVGGPVVFHLAQMKQQSEALKRRILSDPFLHMNKPLFRAILSNPTVTVDLPDTTLNFFTMAGVHLADVVVNGSVSAAVLVDSTPPGQYTLQVTDVNLHIKTTKILGDKSLNGCDLNKLIEHIVNSILKSSLTRFLEQLPLPQPQFTLVGLKFQLLSVQVQDSTLLLGLVVSQTQNRQLQMDTHTLSGETIERAVFGKELDRDFKQPKPGELDATMKLAKVPAVPGFNKIAFRKFNAGSLPGGDLFLSVSQKVFQLLADKYLNINVEKEQSGGGFAHYSYKYGYTVSGPAASIIASGLEITAQLSGNAAGSAGLSGCSSWISVSISATANAVPGAKIDAELLTKNKGRELWIHPFDFPFAIVVHVSISPDIPGLDFILSLVATALLSMFSSVVLPLISLGFEIKLLTLPDSIPGTPVTATPSVSAVGNWDGMLYASMDLQF